jgi:hypothetical protein
MSVDFTEHVEKRGDHPFRLRRCRRRRQRHQDLCVVIQPTSKEMRTPCCDVFYMSGGKIRRFNCYAAGTIMFAQIGVLSNLGAALTQSSSKL